MDLPGRATSRLLGRNLDHLLPSYRRHQPVSVMQTASILLPSGSMRKAAKYCGL
jgi:hypothetical protein